MHDVLESHVQEARFDGHFHTLSKNISFYTNWLLNTHLAIRYDNCTVVVSQWLDQEHSGITHNEKRTISKRDVVLKI